MNLAQAPRPEKRSTTKQVGPVLKAAASRLGKVTHEVAHLQHSIRGFGSILVDLVDRSPNKLDFMDRMVDESKGLQAHPDSESSQN